MYGLRALRCLRFMLTREALRRCSSAKASQRNRRCRAASALGGNAAICSEQGLLRMKYATIGLMILAAVVIGACTQVDYEVSGGYESSDERGASAGGEHGGGDGEESANQLSKSDTYDELRAGSRLILIYDAESNAFTGTVENVTEAPLSRVRVEIHLSNGVELGPTPAVDLVPGASAAVSLAAPDRPFDTWSAHAEVGGGDGVASDGEHDSGGERADGSGGEHGGSRESAGGEHSGGREN